MKSYFRDNQVRIKNRRGFSLVEVVTALIILSLISSSVLVIIDRNVKAATNLTAKMHAFEIARENMETLLSQDSVKEKVDYGTSDKYPDIEWETTVETFYEPFTSQMWVRAICTATYEDTAGTKQEVKLTHWLTNVTKRQLVEILKEKEKRQAQLEKEIVTSVEEAAEFAGVDVDTVEEWVANGMPQTEDGRFIKSMLVLYQSTRGNPPSEQVKQTNQTFVLMAKSLNGGITAGVNDSAAPGSQGASRLSGSIATSKPKPLESNAGTKK